MYYQLNRLRARTKNTDPTQTDQAGAKDTDINVIVKQFGVTGQAPGPAQTPMYGDYTELPQDLRGFIEAARSIRDHIGNLPPKLKNLPLNELLGLPPEEITRILTTPDTPVTTEVTTT